MRFEKEIPENMISYCGINCNVCYVFLKKKKPCLGCRNNDDGKPEHCRKCKIKDCAFIKGFEYCYKCEEYPCAVLKRLNKSYLTRYKENIKENMIKLKETGIKDFLKIEKERWKCPECKGIISVHSKICSECDKDYKTWEEN